MFLLLACWVFLCFIFFYYLLNGRVWIVDIYFPFCLLGLRVLNAWRGFEFLTLGNASFIFWCPRQRWRGHHFLRCLAIHRDCLPVPADIREFGVIGHLVQIDLAVDPYPIRLSWSTGCAH